MAKKSLKIISVLVFTVIISTNFTRIKSVMAGDSIKPVEKRISKVDKMPNSPEDYKMIDWNGLSKSYDNYVFDFDKKGEFLPTGWWDKTHLNMNTDTFGLYSYVGKLGQGKDGTQEAINDMAAVLSATLVGIDKSNQNGVNYVEMLQTYYNTANKEGVILNNPNNVSGQSLWYEVFPHILFYALDSYYPNTNNMDSIMKATADKWYDAVMVLGGKDNDVDFNYTAFDFTTMKPIDNGKWTEPDAAAGVGLLQYFAYKKFGDKKYLEASKQCMDFLEEAEVNPSYEILSSFAPYLATRLNKEEGTNYNVDKMINWQFNGDSSVRNGWGMINGKWGNYAVDGLVGSTTDGGGGYAFAMNTFNTAGALVPLVRYDTRYAKDIGKWILNLANNSRFFYKNEMPKTLQSGAEWKGDAEGVIPYEGLRKEFKGITPYASGDPTVYGWGTTDFSLYSGSYAGMLGGMIHKTNQEKILQIDTLKTDYFRGKSYPTYLYYNPYKDAKDVEITLESEKLVDLYDTVTKSYLAKGIKGKGEFTLKADSAAVIVIVPSGEKIKTENNKLKAEDTVIGYKSAAVNISGLQYKDIVKGTISLDVQVLLEDDDKSQEVNLYLDDDVVYNGKDIQSPINLDTSVYTNGFHTLKATLSTENGIEDTTQITLFIKNEGISNVFSEDANKISKWNSIDVMAGKAELSGGDALITETNESGNWGGVRSDAFELDLSKKPILMIDVNSVTANWALQVHVDGEPWGFYVKQDGNEIGSFTLDIADKLKKLNANANYTGKQKVELWLIVTGKEGAQAKIENIDIFYQDEKAIEYSAWSKGFNVKDMAKWKSTDSMAGKASIKDGKARVLKQNLAEAGGVTSPYMNIDFDKNPSVNVNVTQVSTNWEMMLYIQGEKNGYVIQSPINKTGKFKLDLQKAMKTYPKVKLNGVKKVQLWVLAEGSPAATVDLKSLKVEYEKNLLPFIVGIATGCILICFIIIRIIRKKKKKM